jgi:hypothetical protein
LQQAFAKLEKLPDSQQDAIASIILQEIADERIWDESFANSQDKLATMAQKARADIEAGHFIKTI